MVACKKTWEYFKIDKPIRGKVLSYAKGICGYVAISSNIIIRSSTGDTLRGLELPCYSGIFEKSDSVLVSPVSDPYKAGGVGDIKFDCKVKKTCYAHIDKIK